MAEKKKIRILLFGRYIEAETDLVIENTEKEETRVLTLHEKDTEANSHPMIIKTESESRKISKENSCRSKEKFFKLFGVQIPIHTVSRRRRKMNLIRDKEPIIPPQLPERVGIKIQSMGGTDISFLTEKNVVWSDTKDRYNRLFIPQRGINRIMEALTDDEKRIIGIREDGIIETAHNANYRVEGEIDVVVIDGRDNRYDMCLKLWPSLAQWVLNKEWIKFINGNELETGDLIQIWCFRYEASRQLGFAVVKIKEPETQDVGGGSSNVSSMAMDA